MTIHTKNIYVINRRGERIPMNLMTISTRLRMLANMQPPLSISTDYIATQTACQLVDNIKTSEIDNISANVCASLIIEDIEYDILATRILISDLHKNTSDDLLKYVESIKEYKYRNMTIKLLHHKVIEYIQRYSRELHNIVTYENDYSYNYFGIITMIKSYLLSHKYDNDIKIIKERPQQMLLRVAIGINLNNIDIDGKCSQTTFSSIIDTYRLLSDKYYTHATPTLFNAGTVNHTLSSCYLLSVDDSLDNIYKRLTDISKISKFSGGVGIHTSMVRAYDSVISSTIGRSEGLVPMLRVFNESTKYVSQGGGKRKGSTAVYLEPWHADIESCLLSQRNQGIPETLCKDLFLALWVPDLFMERLRQSIKLNKDIKWSLMCPNECPGLTDVYGEEFTDLYESYEKKKMYRSQVSIFELWKSIISLQIETGKPYIMYKDHVNRKCNQNNLGVIKSSNLCVHGNTRILTSTGYKEIQSLQDQTVDVWNGSAFRPAKVAKTNENVKLLKITFSDGSVLKCTEYHKFLIDNEEVKEAKDLVINSDKLLTCDFPIIKDTDSTYDLQNPYHAAMDHQYSDNYAIVPINSSYKCRTHWLAGIIDVYGEIIGNYNSDIDMQYQQLILTISHKKFMRSIKLLCNTLGLNPHIKDTKLVFSTYETMKIFVNLNIPTLVIKLLDDDYMGIDFDKKFEELTITSIHECQGLYDTYCFNEPEMHRGIFNGVLTEQCSEITIYSDTKNIGVCNLASICLPKFVHKIKENGTFSYKFDYQKLMEVTQKVVYNMNKVIDNNKYPIPEAKYSDDNNRPIGIGTQGLSEVFMIMKEPFDSAKAKEMNKHIFETIYYGALLASNKLAKINGAYENFKSSMTANGILQFDLWNVTPSSNLWDWTELRTQIQSSGLRNSLLISQMPTAGTSIILGHTESVEVPQSNVFTRTTLSGRFQVINKHLVEDLKKLHLWNEKTRNDIVENDGSIYMLEYIPKKIREVYKTIYEYRLSSLIEMCADREAYICQSSSNNRFIANPTISKLTKMHLYTWKLGLKTSSYYIRTKAVTTGSKLTSNKLASSFASNMSTITQYGRNHTPSMFSIITPSIAPSISTSQAQGLDDDDIDCLSCTA